MVAVEVADVRRVGEGGDLRRGLVEGCFDAAAVACREEEQGLSGLENTVDGRTGKRYRTKAGLVASGDEHPPLLRLGGLRADGSVESLLPVVQRQDVQLAWAGLGLSSMNRVMSVRVGDI